MSVRIAFVAPSLGEAEGQGRVNVEVVRRLLDRGFSVDLYTSRLPRGGVPGARVRTAPRPFAAELPNQLLFVVWATVLVARRRYDVVHADGSSLLRRADVVAAHMLHSVWRTVAGAARRPGFRGAYHAFSAWLNAALERRAYRGATLVLANSSRTADDLVRVVGVMPEKIRVMPLGVDAVRFHVPDASEREDARARLGAGADEIIAVLVGAAEPRKGVPQAIEAVAALDKVRLIVVGDPRDGAAERQARRLNANVTFVPWPADPLPYYLAADMLIHPSPYEPFGMTVLEAMGCGLAVAVNRTAGVMDAVRGAALPIDSTPLSIRDAVTTLIDDPGRRAQMGAAGRAIARERTWDATADAVAAAYREVAA